MLKQDKYSCPGHQEESAVLCAQLVRCQFVTDGNKTTSLCVYYTPILKSYDCTIILYVVDVRTYNILSKWMCFNRQVIINYVLYEYKTLSPLNRQIHVHTILPT